MVHKQNLKVVAVIPAYNEKSNIGYVVKKSLKYVDRVFVVDDGSKDNTVSAAQKGGAVVSKMARNFGVGFATCCGFGVCQDADVIVTLDADGQHDPNDIPKLLMPAIKQKVDLVIGSRFLNGDDIPRYRTFGIKLITWLYNFGHKHKLSDAQSCFRAYSRKLLDSLIISENGFGFSVETLIKARKMSFGIVEVPITCKYHDDYKQNSTLNPIKHGALVVWAILKWRFLLWN